MTLGLYSERPSVWLTALAKCARAAGHRVEFRNLKYLGSEFAGPVRYEAIAVDGDPLALRPHIPDTCRVVTAAPDLAPARALAQLLGEAPPELLPWPEWHDITGIAVRGTTDGVTFNGNTVVGKTLPVTVRKPRRPRKTKPTGETE